MEQLLSIKEAASLLSLSPYTLRIWTFQRRIPFIRLGRRIAFRKQDLMELVNKNLVEARRGA